LAPWAHALYACDRKWWKHHIDDVKAAFKGELYTQNVGWKPGEAEALGLTVLQSVDEPGLSKEQGIIHQGKNSGYQAVNLAYLMGATQIFLLGYDMGCSGKTHFFGDHPDAVGNRRNYSQYIRHFDTIKEIEVINLSRETALNFPRADIDQVCGIGNRPKSRKAA